MRRLAAAGLVAVAVAGCAGGSHRRAGSDRLEQPNLSDRQVIRGWLAALDAADYVSAGSYFAPGALVEQSEIFRLHSRAEAVQFNSGLPCKGDLGKVRDEGPTTLADFHLRRGPGGNCHGTVQVRFTIRHGKFTEWRQLPRRRPPSGEAA